MAIKAVDILTYKKAVDFKKLHNASWQQTATKLNLTPAELHFIREHYNGFLESKRIEEEMEIENIKKQLN